MNQTLSIRIPEKEIPINLCRDKDANKILALLCSLDRIPLASHSTITKSRCFLNIFIKPCQTIQSR